MSSMIPNLENLLTLQETDLAISREQSALRRFPLEIESIEKEIKQNDETLKEAKDQLNAKEIARKEHETSLASEEAKIQKFLTQQLSVKKNDEYQALNREIDMAREKVSDEEEAILMALDDIEETRKSFHEKQSEYNNRKEILQKRIDEQVQLQGVAQERLVGFQRDREAQADKLSEDLLRRYEQVKMQVRNGPYVCKLENHKCSGCHLRVANEVDQSVRAGNLQSCDQCGRLLFV